MPVVTRSSKSGELVGQHEIDGETSDQEEIIASNDGLGNIEAASRKRLFDWEKYRKYEKEKLQSIRWPEESELINFNSWLKEVTKIYDEIHLSDDNRINQTMSITTEKEKEWFEEERNSIGSDWDKFSMKLCQHVLSQLKISGDKEKQKNKLGGEKTPVEIHDLDHRFPSYSSRDDAEHWLKNIVKLFKQFDISRTDRLKILPNLLEGEVYIWYVKNLQAFNDLETFSNMFLQKFSMESSIPLDKKLVTTTSLANTMAQEIIKSPSPFTGANEDVEDWLERLEARFNMAGWEDDQKLRYISIHLKNDAYKWWMKAVTKIKTWTAFKNSVRQAFGSTKIKEMAFEQLRNYKQTINQSVIQYYEKIIELCQRVDPDMSDTMKLQYLMTGVRDSLKIHIVLHDPQSTEAFLTFAKKIEDALSLTKLNHNSHQREFQEDQVNYSDTLSALHNRKKDGDHIISGNQNREKTTENPYFQTRKNNHTRTHQSENNLVRQPNYRKCYKCGTPGHNYWDCARSHFDERKHR